MKARIVSFERDFMEFDDVKLIRVKSKQLSALIMEDHLPMIGDITGRVEILTADDHIVLDDVDGYYMHKKNVFELVLKD